jgi:hypothetical protein
MNAKSIDQSIHMVDDWIVTDFDHYLKGNPHT